MAKRRPPTPTSPPPRRDPRIDQAVHDAIEAVMKGLGALLVLHSDLQSARWRLSVFDTRDVAPLPARRPRKGRKS